MLNITNNYRRSWRCKFILFDNKKNNNSKDKNIKNFGFWLILCLVLVTVIRLATLNDKSVEYQDKEIIINKPDQVTYLNDFKKLLNEDKVDTVYIEDNSGVLLFTVKDGVKVKSVKYKTNQGYNVGKLVKQSEKYVKEKVNSKDKDKYILTYRSFNPQTEEFDTLLYSKDVQVIKLPSPKEISFLSALASSSSIVLVILMTRYMLFPDGFTSDDSKNSKNKSTVRLDDISGHKEIKEDLLFTLDCLQNPKKYEGMGAEIPKGLLFYGPPGNGKTLLAKALAGEASIPFYPVSGPDFLDKFVGMGPQRVKSLFKKARKNAPCIIFIDEIDSIGSARSNANNKGFDEVLNQFLIELDGFEPNRGILVIAATNRVDTLDEALIRPGRFDRQILINNPDKLERLALLKSCFEGKTLDESVDMDKLAGLLYGFSNAKVKYFVNDAALIAAKKNKKAIDNEDIDESYVKQVLSANIKKRANAEEEVSILAYHEAGHALITKLCTNDTINKVTIVGTTGNTGGFVSSTPRTETLISRYDFYNKIRVLYGGRIAEYIYFNEDFDKVTSGAANDLEQVNYYLDIIISSLGMDEGLLFALPESERKNNQDVMNAKKELSKKLFNETLELMINNKQALIAIADALINKESLTSDELDAILEPYSLEYL